MMGGEKSGTLVAMQNQLLINNIVLTRLCAFFFFFSGVLCQYLQGKNLHEKLIILPSYFLLTFHICPTLYSNFHRKEHSDQRGFTVSERWRHNLQRVSTYYLKDYELKKTKISFLMFCYYSCWLQDYKNKKFDFIVRSEQKEKKS